MTDRVVQNPKRFTRKLGTRVALFLLVFEALISTGCAYRLGRPPRKLPGGYTQVSVPVFKNLTFEPGIEMAFTSSLIYEFERSRVAVPVRPELAEVEVVGEIRSLRIEPQGLREQKEGIRQPEGTVISSAYRLLLEVEVSLRKVSDQSVLWKSSFTDERTYTAPSVIQGGLNTVNPLYNQSARRQNIESLAGLMMSEAHDRMMENF